MRVWTKLPDRKPYLPVVYTLKRTEEGRLANINHIGEESIIEVLKRSTAFIPGTGLVLYPNQKITTRKIGRPVPLTVRQR